MLKQEDATQIL